ncbi:MarP family serine protease [Leifsonia sp. 21MFCrub1.1]|uniref:MarP family serine protease n=1 Tax=Leifsonia sp. 21MFCrub1.1 TaxID=1798223 RepID=UPI0008929613|nr:MarP family serine protease [Leifsonia sp. 21MFCrub1.1]SEB13406.1 Colicin V production protein [Leifsonia sp. 21MFCrub1.1]
MEIVVDVVLVVLGILAIAAGWSKGAIRSAGTLVGLGLGLWLGLTIAPIVVGWFAASGFGGVTQRSVVAAVVIIVCAGVVYAIAGALASIIGRLLRHGPIRWLDSLIGAVLGLATWAVVVWLLAGFAMATSLATVVQAANSSRVVATLNSIAPLPSSTVLGAVDDALAGAGLPQVFAGAETIKAVPAPDGSVPAAVSASEQSVVTVLASKPACGVDSEGSGWVVQRGRVVTNAHVVAGSSSVVVRMSGSQDVERATLVAFDPSRDLAVLDVTDLTAPALDIGPDLTADAAAYAAGYPGNGPFTVSPQRVRDRVMARGTDIYQSGSVDRDIYSLRGVVRPGNSGGPLLDAQGRVAGVVFARSATNPDTGYALTLAELRPVLSSVGSAPISSGACSAG